MKRGWESWCCSVQRREDLRDFLATFQYLKGISKHCITRHFTKACSERTSGNGFKLKEGRFSLDIRKKFLMMSVVRHWNRLSGEVVDVQSLEVFKVRLDRALSNLIGERCPCPWQRHWTRWFFKVPSKPNHSMILWFYKYMILCFYESTILSSWLVARCSPSPFVTPNPQQEEVKGNNQKRIFGWDKDRETFLSMSSFLFTFFACSSVGVLHQLKPSGKTMLKHGSSTGHSYCQDNLIHHSLSMGPFSLRKYPPAPLWFLHMLQGNTSSWSTSSPFLLLCPWCLQGCLS